MFRIDWGRRHSTQLASSVQRLKQQSSILGLYHKHRSLYVGLTLSALHVIRIFQFICTLMWRCVLYTNTSSETFMHFIRNSHNELYVFLMLDEFSVPHIWKNNQLHKQRQYKYKATLFPIYYYLFKQIPIH